MQPLWKNRLYIVQSLCCIREVAYIVQSLWRNLLERWPMLIDSTRRGHATSCTVKILVVAKNSDKCVGGAKWKPFSSPRDACHRYSGACWRLG